MPHHPAQTEEARAEGRVPLPVDGRAAVVHSSPAAFRGALLPRPPVSLRVWVRGVSEWMPCAEQCEPHG